MNNLRSALPESFNGDLGNAIEEALFAYEEVPFFGEYYSKIDVYGVRNEEDWRKLPLTEKVHYRTNFPFGIVANGWNINDTGITRLQSSGSEGDRLVTVMHTFALAERMATCVKVNEELGYLLEAEKIRACRYAAPNCSDVECANPNIRKEDRMLPDGTLVLSVYHDLLATPKRMLDQAFQEVVDYSPHYLYIDPNHLCHLMSHVKENDVREPEWSRCAVLSTYSHLTRIHRRRLRHFFGPNVPVVNVLAMSELGFVAIECHHQRLHINNVDYYLELLDVDGNPVRVGEPGELCISTVGDRLSPKLRYLTGDLYAAVDGPCPCGSPLPVVRYLGRRRYLLSGCTGEPISAAMLDEAVGDRPWLRQYQCEKFDGPRFVVHCIPEYAPDEEELKRLRDSVAELLKCENVSIDLTGYIPAERSGKFLTCKNSERGGK